ncbi:uncharacterized protein Dvar_62160 [Desulfosarcina variabilis str. Montpellier]|uniref:hypothetical protein n=1 Tax=Desulfosarcina variabilis TaxID=2300 RepID=UPI003AFB4ECE
MKNTGFEIGVETLKKEGLKQISVAGYNVNNLLLACEIFVEANEKKCIHLCVIEGKTGIGSHLLDSVHPEIGKFGRDQGALKILPQTYG